MRVARNRVAALETLVFPSERDNFWSFVSYSRSGGTPHSDLAHRSRAYDIVVGPVTLAGQTLIIGGADQISFHTAAAVATLINVRIRDTGNLLFNVTP